MEIDKYVEQAKYLIHLGIPESITCTIIQELGKDRRTDTMEQGKNQRVDTVKNDKDNQITSKQKYFLKESGYLGDLNNLTKAQASDLIKKYKSNN